MTFIVRVALMIILLNGTVAHLHAEVLGHITLRDGSVLYGEIMGMTDGILTARTASSTGNPIRFKWEEITSLSTEQPIILILDNGQTLTGVVTSVEPGTIQLQAGQSDGPIPIILRTVNAINPPEGESASGGETDEIILKNGDRITGEILSMEGGSLKVRTSYAGDVTINWSEVQLLISHKPLSVKVLEDGEEIDDEEFADTIQRTVNTLADSVSSPLSRVQGINIPDVRYKGDFDLGGNRTDGNTNTTALNASAEGTIWTRRHRVKLSGKYAFAQAEGRETANNARSTLRYDYFLTKKLFLTGNEFLEQDQFQGLNIRSTTGVGVGYQFLNRPGHTLSGYVGPSFVHEQFVETGKTNTASFAWDLDWKYDLIANRVKLFHKQKGFRDLGGGGSEALRWVAEQGVRVEVYGGMYLKLEYDYRFNSEPEPGKKESDEAFIWGAGYAFSN